MNSGLHFLKISGVIHAEKHHEFQQTVQFIFNQLPQQCVKREFSIDIHNADLYHIYTLWQSEQSLIAFKFSNELNLLSGAFQTLGTNSETVTGRWMDVQLFNTEPLAGLVKPE